MPSPPDLDSFRELQREIETFLKSLAHPVVVEDEVEVLDLTAARWKLSVEFGKLLFEAWNPLRSIARRVVDVAYRDRGRMGLFVMRPGGRATGTLEFRELDRAERTERKVERGRFRRELLAVLGREFPGWRFERVSNRSDREHSFSAWYARGWARQGRTAWAFLGLADGESPAAADAVLAFGLIWLDWLRADSDRATVTGLKLFLPPGAIDPSAYRAVYLDRRVAQVEIFELSAGRLRAVDLRDFGNVETHLVPRPQGESLAERHREMARNLVGRRADHVDLVPDPSGTFLSLRVLGLEIARLEGQLAPRVYFGLEGNVRRMEESNRAEFLRFLDQVLELRKPGSENPSHPYYALQSERWLERELVRDISKIDPALSPDCVYPQVPAFSGRERGVIDILSVTRAGRLAVIELKLQEEINLPLQGLDYWLRVKWLAERGRFREFGYFPGVELAGAPPLLYLVSPAFRFHSTIHRVVRYLDPSIEVIQVGVNDQWREGVKTLFRRELRAGPERAAPGVRP